MRTDRVTCVLAVAARRRVVHMNSAHVLQEQRPGCTQHSGAGSMNVFRKIIVTVVGAWRLVSSAVNAWQLAQPATADATEQLQLSTHRLEVHSSERIADSR